MTDPYVDEAGNLHYFAYLADEMLARHGWPKSETVCSLATEWAKQHGYTPGEGVMLHRVKEEVAMTEFEVIVPVEVSSDRSTVRGVGTPSAASADRVFVGRSISPCDY